MLETVETEPTPLLKQIAKLGRVIALGILALAGLTFLFGLLFRDYQAGQLLLAVISLAIAMIPEGLPAMVSIILALGVQSMARRKAIVRNLPAVETLGSISVICSDKTGTLTQNEMTVTELVGSGGRCQVTGAGYAPVGDLFKDGVAVDARLEPDLSLMLDCFNQCRKADVGQDQDGHWISKGDPTEGALAALTVKAGLKTEMRPRLDVIPFDSEYKYMAVLTAGDQGNSIYIKGAPEKILAMADQLQTPTGYEYLNLTAWHDEVARLAGTGLRTIAVACKAVDTGVKSVSHQDLAEGVCFVGLAGMIDPPRPEAALQALVISEGLYVFNCRSVLGPAFGNNFFKNKVVFGITGVLILFQLALTYVPAMNRVMGTAPLEPAMWIPPFVLAIVIFCLVEVEKLISKKFYQARKQVV